MVVIVTMVIMLIRVIIAIIMVSNKALVDFWFFLAIGVS